MRTTVVHRRHTMPLAGFPRPALHPLRSDRPVAGMPINASTPSQPWSTMKLGFVISAIAAGVAVVLDLVTELPGHVIVLSVMVVAFAASCHATVRRPYR